MYQRGTILLLTCLALIHNVQGNLLHVWSFEGDYTDTIGRVQAQISGSPVITNTAANLSPTPCSQLLLVGNNSWVEFPVNATSNFMISFWFFMYPPTSDTALIISQRNGCSANYWQLSYSAIYASLTLSFSDGQNAVYLQAPFVLQRVWNYITFSHNETGYLFYLQGELVGSSSLAVDLNMQSSINFGRSTCGPQNTNATIAIDELQIYDSFEDPFELIHSSCIQEPPLAIFESVAADHSSFIVTYYSFYISRFFRASTQFLLTYANNDTEYNLGSFNDKFPVNGYAPNTTHTFQLKTIWPYTINYLVSSSTLSPVGTLRHMYLFDGNYSDVLSNATSTTTGTGPTFFPGICKKALYTNFSELILETLTLNIPDITYSNDFTISFWMYLQGPTNESTFALLNQREACGADGSFWEFRYYYGQFLALDFYSNYNYFSRVRLTYNTSSIDFMQNWHHIVFTRNGYEVAMYVNGTSVAQTVYMNVNISNTPLKIADSVCVADGDKTTRPPVLIIDELQIYDIFIDPALINENPCIQNVLQPIITNDTGIEFYVTTKNSFYDRFIPQHACEFTYQTTEGIENQECSSRPIIINGTQNVTMEVTEAYSFGIYTSQPFFRQAYSPTATTSSSTLAPSTSSPGLPTTTGNFTTSTLTSTSSTSTSSATSSTTSPIPTPPPTPSPTPYPTPSPSPLDCRVNNGGCDYRVQCTDLAHIYCGTCPTGTFGNGYTCTSYCGDSNCTAEYGENCVSCPFDCQNVTCDICGDGVCNGNESCKTCPEDCQCPPEKTAKCPSGCSGHGSCNNGLCSCEVTWAGPDCSTEGIQPITVNQTNSGVTITTPVSPVQFFIGVISVSEWNSNNEVVRSFSLQDYSMTASKSNVGPNTVYYSSVMLENSALLNISIWEIEALTSFEFAGTTELYAPHSLKITVRAQNWPFMALSNSLAITFESSANEGGCVNSKSDDTGILQWIEVIVNDISLYGQFETKAEVDGRIRVVSYQLGAGNLVSAILPHFWDYAELDPNYSVLLGDNNHKSCKQNSHHSEKLIAVYVVVPFVGVVLLVCFFVFGLPRLRDMWQIKRTRSNLLRSVEMDAKM